jgi:hypothetical protein
MGISMAGDGAFSYNRFDALNEAYSSLYEEKEEKDEDDVSDEEASAIKKEVKKHAKDMHSDDDESEDESEEEESEEESEDEDEEKSDKKFPSFLKKSKGEEVEGKLPKGTMKEEIINYLMDEGFVNNEVSAEVMVEHMNPEWMEAIIEGYKKLPVGKMINKMRERSADLGAHQASGYGKYDDMEDTERHEKKSDKMQDVLIKHDAQSSKEKSDENRDNAYRKRQQANR